MRKSILAALAFMPLASPAFATDWYVLDYHGGQCIRGDKIGPTYVSPSVFEEAMRQAGEFKETHVLRDDNGDVLGAIIDDRDGMAMSFFSSAAVCERAKQKAIEAGGIAKPGELR
jgi:hypothetical protein